MDQIVRTAVAQLVRIFSWLIQALISYTGPGLIFIAIYPSVALRFQLSSQPDFELALLLIWASAIGLVLTAIASIIFAIVGHFIGLDNWLVQQFIDRQSGVVAGSANLAQFIQALPPEQRQQWQALSQAQIANIVNNTANQLVRRQLNEGMFQSFSVFTSGGGVTPELQSLLIGTETQLAFAYGLFGGSIAAFVIALSRILQNGSVVNVLMHLVAVFLLWVVSLAMYVAYQNSRLGAFLGIATSRNARPAGN